MADTRTTFEEYVVWYWWARTNFPGEAVVGHAAAAAATHVLAAGGDRRAAAIAACHAAGDEAALNQTRATYGPRHCYVEWFVWARANLGLPDDRCHEAAQAALGSLAAGGTQQGAVEAAMRRLPQAGASWLLQPKTGDMVGAVHPAAGGATSPVCELCDSRR